MTKKNERLRMARKGAGMSQKDLGDLLGKHGTMVSLYETGKANQQSPEILKKWAELTGVSFEWLMGEGPDDIGKFAPSYRKQKLEVMRKRLIGSRIGAGLERKDLADLIGIHYTTIYRAERGVQRLTKGNVEKWAEATGVTPEWLFGEDVSQSQQKKTAEPVQQEQEVKPNEALKAEEKDPSFMAMVSRWLVRKFEKKGWL